MAQSSAAKPRASSSSEPIAIQRVRPQQAGRLELTSSALDAEGRIGDIYSCYHDNLSPPLEWTSMPEAETFMLIMQDPDAPTEKPVLHWAAWNIPGRVNTLPTGVRQGPVLNEFAGTVQGCNARGEFGYMGPRPPAGDGPHRYHFQLFALDMRLDMPPTAPLEALIQVLKAHAIASADLMGTYEYGPARRAPVKPSERSFAGKEGRGGLDEDDMDLHAPHNEDGVVRPHP